MNVNPLVYWGFRLYSRVRSMRALSAVIVRERDACLAVTKSLSDEELSQRVRLAPMPGLGPDMLYWSVAMTLEHLALVQRGMRLVVARLATGRNVTMQIDYENDFTPHPEAGREQVAAFTASVENYLRKVEKLPKLRDTPRFEHFIFGDLDAQGWHALFGAHLLIHRRQLQVMAEELSKAPL